MIRHAAVAGRFYPSNKQKLTSELTEYLKAPEKRRKALGCVVPHAGYMYSGHVAGAVFASLDLPERFVILCPNHTGMGTPLSIMSSGEWETPLGKVSIDSDLAGKLMHLCTLLSEDDQAHLAEHSLEVQLPFLQRQKGEFTFVPIALGTGSYAPLERLGLAVAEVVKQSTTPVLIVASSDMNHYESDEITRVKDRRAIDRVLALDSKGLFDVIKREHVTMCGYGPAIAMLTAARQLGASQAELVKYATSGDITGDRDAVVGYAGMVVW
ncbi:MAG: AmmeMemoRadiSam system protein B [Acidobacteriia bacterium]|nr:AmmeMemoRadiSam system protein B [Terriglobia bacterium]